MNAPTKARIEAERIYSVVSFPPYRDTIHQWLEDILNAATEEMSREDDPIRNAKARGRYSAVKEVIDRINLILARRDAEATRLVKKQQK